MGYENVKKKLLKAQVERLRKRGRTLREDREHLSAQVSWLSKALDEALNLTKQITTTPEEKWAEERRHFTLMSWDFRYKFGRD